MNNNLIYDYANFIAKSNQKYQPWNKPEGRLSRLNDLKLVECDEPLYIPITQEPVPKTEDQMEDDAEVMLRLGLENGMWYPPIIIIYCTL